MDGDEMPLDLDGAWVFTLHFLFSYGIQPWVRHRLKLGERIWPTVTSFATEFLIASNFNVYAVAERLGDMVTTVEPPNVELLPEEMVPSGFEPE